MISRYQTLSGVDLPSLFRLFVVSPGVLLTGPPSGVCGHHRNPEVQAIEPLLTT